MNSTTDGLPYYCLRKEILSWEDFLKGFTEKIELKTVLSPLTRRDLADIYAVIEKRNFSVESVLMNAVTYSDMRKWDRDILDIETNKEECQKGLMAKIWGAYIMVCNKIPDRIIIVSPEENKKVCATLELGQEKYYGLEGINSLKEEAADLTKKLVNVYAKMEEMVDRTLLSLKNK